MNRLRMTGLLLVIACGWAGRSALWAEPATKPRDESPNRLRERISRWIEDLGSARHAVREAAQNELIRIGYPALPALQKATGSADAEVSVRAQRIMEILLAHSHAILDALGRPIGGAEVRIAGTIWGDDANKPRTFLTDSMGHVDIPPPDEARKRVPARIAHADYGVASVTLNLPGDQQRALVPLVRRLGKEGSRALRGVVLGPDGKPLAGATVRCSEIRTPGEGLIVPVHGQVVLTDERGRFFIYPVLTGRRSEERGKLIPLNSTYNVLVSHEADETPLPRAGRFSSAAEARIRLQRPTRRFRLQFEGLDGKPVADPKQLARIVLYYEERRELGKVPVPPRYVTEGRGKLLDGTYHVQGPSSRYLPLKVGADSPETLTFRLAPPVTFHGRVVDGVTGRPIAGAFVMGWSGTAHNNLAMLTDEQWDALDDLPAAPGLDHAALKPIRKMYIVQAVARTGPDGRFELVQPLGKQFYGIMAFGRDLVPFRMRTFSLKVGADHRAAAADLPLYPAAKVLVRPVLKVEDPRRNVSVSPRWRLLKHGQPKWVARFRQALPYQSAGEYEYIHWMKLNQRQPLYVPAAVLLKLALETPYDDQWTTATIGRVIHLEQGESLDLGEVGFRRALRVQVRVADKNGDPVEGAPVRRLYDSGGAWCVAHNTDAKGLARLYVDANSTGKFGVRGLHDRTAKKPPETAVRFKIGKTVDASKPYVIRLTDEQVRLLRGLRKKRPAPPPIMRVRN